MYVSLVTGVMNIINTGMELAYLIKEAKKNKDRFQLHARPTQRLIEFNQVNQMSCANVLNSLNMITNIHNQLSANLQIMYSTKTDMDDSKKEEMKQKMKIMDEIYQKYKDKMISYCDDYSEFHSQMDIASQLDSIYSKSYSSSVSKVMAESLNELTQQNWKQSFESVVGQYYSTRESLLVMTEIVSNTKRSDSKYTDLLKLI